MMSDAKYGARVRAREKFTRKNIRTIQGKNGKQVNIVSVRKSGAGVETRHDITKPMPPSSLAYIRERAREVVRTALHRRHVLHLSRIQLVKRLVG
ncbi:MAG: hypothetical protein C5B59_06535 [Bacteroidetes bacterium]|nr:MAG: hypothetical protein C5B59_06535 [Bacteroidota bacterium]